MRRLLGPFIVLLVLLPASAVAHGSGVKTNPDHGAQLATMPPEATVSIGEPPKQVDVVLEDPAGTVRKLKPQVDGSTTTVQLPSDGPRGDYTLSYRVVSADGHPVSGSATFTVTTGPDPVAPVPSPTPTVTTQPSADEPQATAWPGLAMSGGAALVALAAGLLFWLMRR